MFLDKLMSQEKLIEIMRENEVGISKKGNICLNDFVDKVMESKNTKSYIKRLRCDKIDIKGRQYVSPDDCIEILKGTNKKVCKDICLKIEEDEDDHTNFIDVEEQIFQFDGHKFLSFFVEKGDGEWDVWVAGSEVARYLDYTNTRQAIMEHVDEDNKCSYSDICELFESTGKKVGLLKNMDYKNIQKITIFINRAGLNELAFASKKPIAVKFAKFLGISVRSKKLYDEQNILQHLIKFFDISGISYVLQYRVMRNNNKYYLIDCYLTDYKIAIEIDEDGHKNRDQSYEMKRQKYIRQKLQCVFLRINPDDDQFDIFNMIGQITKMICDIKDGLIHVQTDVAQLFYNKMRIGNSQHQLDHLKLLSDLKQQQLENKELQLENKKLQFKYSALKDGFDLDAD